MKAHKSSELPVIHKSNNFFTTFDHIQKMIRDRAYHIFHNRAPDQGDEISDWLNAESELLTDIDLTLQDDKDQVVIRGNLKGFRPKEIEVRVKDGLFQITGVHAEENSSTKKGETKITTQQVNFCRLFNLPDSVDADKMEVKIKSGKFTARIPKTSH